MGEFRASATRRHYRAPLALRIYAVTAANSRGSLRRLATTRWGAMSSIRTAPSNKLDAGKSWRDPGFDQNDQDPVLCVSYDDALRFVDWLNTRVRAGAVIALSPVVPAVAGTRVDLWLAWELLACATDGLRHRR
jgi:formylglycine-generating enzyme required for sulfatase activity